MLKATNCTACFALVAFFGALALGEIPQDVVKKSELIWFWLPAAWYGLGAGVNLRREG